MEYEYVISLKRPSYKYIDIISQLLLALFLVQFGMYVATTKWNTSILIQLIVPLAIVGFWIYNIKKIKTTHIIVYYRLPLIMAGIGWLLVPMSWRWIGLAYGILGLMERFIKFPDEIGIGKEGVTRNTLPKKKYEWIDIDNIIIRDNLFTLDLRNNKIIQKELEEPISKVLENEFNYFCKEMLHFSLKEEKK